MASISPRSQEFEPNPAVNSSCCSSESLSLLLPLSTLLVEGDRISSKSEEYSADMCLSASTISDIKSPLIFKKQIKETEKISNRESILEDSPRHSSFPSTQEFSRDSEKSPNGKREQVAGTYEHLSIESNEEYCNYSCCRCFR
jgi:hypothetical protein